MLRELRRMFRPLELDSPLSLDECIERLGRLTKPAGLWDGMTMRGGEVTCTIRGNRFCLFVRPPQFSGNVFLPYFYGQLTREPKGTTLTGRCRPPLFVIVATVIWYCGFVAGGMVFIVLSLFVALEGDGGVGPAIGIFGVGLGPVVIANLFVWLVAVQGCRRYYKKLEDFVIKVFDVSTAADGR